MFIQLHSSTRPLPAPSYALRCPFPVSSLSFLHKFSFVRRGMGGGYYRHSRASASFAFRPPIASFRFSCLFVFFVVKPSFRIVELHANPAQALQLHSGSPADPNGSRRSGRGLPPRLQPLGPVFLRGPTAYPAGLWMPSAEGALQFRRIRLTKFGHLLHRSRCSLSLTCGGGPARLSGAESFGALKVA